MVSPVTPVEHLIQEAYANPMQPQLFKDYASMMAALQDNGARITYAEEEDKHFPTCLEHSKHFTPSKLAFEQVELYVNEMSC